MHSRTMIQIDSRNERSSADRSSGVFKKTQMCKFFQLNMCNRGDACAFAHNEHELQPVPDLHKTKMCTTWLKQRECFDLDCPYAHSRNELRTVSFDRTTRKRFSPTDHPTPLVQHGIEESSSPFFMLPKDTGLSISRQTTAASTQDCSIFSGDLSISRQTSAASAQDNSPFPTSPSTDGSQFDDDWSNRGDSESHYAMSGLQSKIKSCLLALHAQYASGVERVPPPPSPPDMYDSVNVPSGGLFKKTKMCKFFHRNMCKQGDACTYAHSQRELQPLPDLQKTKMCPNMSSERPWCADPSCQYAHAKGELRTITIDKSKGESKIHTSLQQVMASMQAQSHSLPRQLSSNGSQFDDDCSDRDAAGAQWVIKNTFLELVAADESTASDVGAKRLSRCCSSPAFFHSDL